jgi:mannitol 2-dehydrogenase
MRNVARQTIRLSQAALPEVARRGVPVPTYRRAKLAPHIVHVGVGGFHRSHLAVYMDELASGGADSGIVGLGLLERDAAMARALSAQDHLYTLIQKGAGEPSASVIGSIIGFVHAPDPADPVVDELLASPSTSILSLTVTEAGYAEPTAERARDVRSHRRRARGSPGAGRRPADDPQLRQPAGQRRCGAARDARGRRARRRDPVDVGGGELHLPELDGGPHHAGHR